MMARNSITRTRRASACREYVRDGRGPDEGWGLGDRSWPDGGEGGREGSLLPDKEG